MSTLAKSINNKYSDDEDDQDDYGFIVFISCSPETKQGLLPHTITLNDYHIERLGDCAGLELAHIAELDLTDNLIADWDEVLNILSSFPQLVFLNLSNNLLISTKPNQQQQKQKQQPNQTKPNKLNNRKMKKLVLNGNRVSWSSLVAMVRGMGGLEELHLSNNCLTDPQDIVFKHEHLRCFYLSCNQLSDFDMLMANVISHCPSLEFLSIAECPVHSIPDLNKSNLNANKLQSLNVSTTALSNWDAVDRLCEYPALSELRIQGCQFLDEYSEHERRMLLISRLPNVKVLNGGDFISGEEREDAERAFIRYFLDTAEDARPSRFQQLTEIHGLLKPLVHIDLTPEVNILVKIYYREECREERISVRQTVKHFKHVLQREFGVSASIMRLYYYDQVMSEVSGPEEMKYGSKGLYTYNVREGDYFVIDEKATLKPVRTQRSVSLQFGTSPRTPTSPNPRPGGRGFTSLSAKSGAKLNFGEERNPVRRRYSSGNKPGNMSGSVSSGGGTPPDSASSACRSLYGEFHHSKVFRDSK